MKNQMKALQHMLNSIGNNPIVTVVATVFSTIYGDTAGLGIQLIQPVSQILSNAIENGINNDLNIAFDNAYNDELKHCIKETVDLIAKKAPAKLRYLEPICDYLADKCQTEHLNSNLIISEIEKAISDKEYSLTENEIENIKDVFLESFQTCLFFHPNLNSYLLRLRVNKLEEEVNDLRHQQSSIISQIKAIENHLDDSQSKIVPLEYIAADTFIHHLRRFEEKDGMMKCLSLIFMDYFNSNTVDIDIIRYLSKIQDAYNYDFEKYNSIPIGRSVSDSIQPDALSLIFDLEQRERIYALNNNIIEFYLSFIAADYWYFNDIHSNAVEMYWNVNKKLDGLSEITAETMNMVKLYIGNSIGWTIQNSKGTAGKISDAVSVYMKIFPDENVFTSVKNSFVSTYRRNYGVCLDNLGRYEEALVQYEISIRLLPPYSVQYKPYTVYSSAIMKEWDQRYEKISMKWRDNVKASVPQQKWDISHDLINHIKMYLAVAEKHKADFPDIYIKKAKVITYEILLLNGECIDEEYSKQIDRKYQEAIRNIDVAQCLYCDINNSIYFTKRDLFFALYLTNKESTGTEWLDMAMKENEKLNGVGDSIEFKEMVLREKSLLTCGW